MTVHRLDAPAGADGCPAPENVHTAAMDGGPVYGTDATYLREVLREPDSCRLRASKAGMLPITSSADSKGRFFFISGDLRVDEHGLLTCMHTVRAPATHDVPPGLPRTCTLLGMHLYSCVAGRIDLSGFRYGCGSIIAYAMRSQPQEMARAQMSTSISQER